MLNSDLKPSRGPCLSPRAWLAAEASGLSRLQGWEVPVLPLRKAGPPQVSCCPHGIRSLSQVGRCSLERQRDGCLEAFPTEGLPPFSLPSTGNSQVPQGRFAFLLIVPKLSSGKKARLHPRALPGMGQGCLCFPPWSTA